MTTNNTDLSRIVGNGSRWTNPCRHVFGTVFGTAEHFDKFVEMCEGLYNTGDLTRVVIGEELAPSTGRPHLHITASHSGKKSFNWWRTKLVDSGLYLSGDNRDDSTDSPEAGVFGLWMRVQRSTNLKAKEYVGKNGNLRLDLDNDAGRHQGERNDLGEFLEDVKSGRCTSTRDVMESHPKVLARFPRFVQLAMTTYVEVDPTRGAPLPSDLRSWQIDLLEIALRNPELGPDVRAINVVVGTVGNEGKSFMGRYLQRIVREHFGRPAFKVQVIRPNKGDNMAYVLREDNDVIIFDVPRAKSVYFQYHLCEEIKDGLVTSYKYEPREMLLKPCHVFIFTNDFTNEDDKGHTIFSDDRLRWLQIGESDMRPRRFEEARQRLARADPEVPNHGPEFRGDNAGDGPVMNNACYRLMNPEVRVSERLIEGLPVREEREVCVVSLEDEKPYGHKLVYNLENWPSADSLSIFRPLYNERWCMKDGCWKTLGMEVTGEDPPYYASGPVRGLPSTWYVVRDGKLVETRSQSLFPRLPVTLSPYLRCVVVFNRVDYSRHYGWRKGCAPPREELGEAHMTDLSDRTEPYHPRDHPGGYDAWFQEYLLPRWNDKLEKMYSKKSDT